MIKTPFGYCPGIPKAVIEILNPNIFGLIESTALLICKRRKLDKIRNRDEESIEQIEYHQQISRSFLLACMVFSGALYTPIQNQSTPIDAAKQLIALIQSYNI